jgi:predicted nuclease with TOPRIM domain
MSTIVLDRKEWEQLLQDTERLVKNYEKLLERVRTLEAEKNALENRLAALKGLETEKAVLEERLRSSQSQLLELQQKLSSFERQLEIDSRGTATIKELRSSMSRLLKE